MRRLTAATVPGFQRQNRISVLLFSVRNSVLPSYALRVSKPVGSGIEIDAVHAVVRKLLGFMPCETAVRHILTAFANLLLSTETYRTLDSTPKIEIMDTHTVPSEIDRSLGTSPAVNGGNGVDAKSRKTAANNLICVQHSGTEALKLPRRDFMLKTADQQGVHRSESVNH